MVVGIGTDLVEIARIEVLYQKHPSAFARRVLSSQELVDFSGHAQPVHFLAKRWAAKEAISKALGTGFRQGFSFMDMTISHSPLGQPLIQLSGETAIIAHNQGIHHWSISLSDEKHYALAFVIAEKGASNPL